MKIITTKFCAIIIVIALYFNGYGQITGGGKVDVSPTAPTETTSGFNRKAFPNFYFGFGFTHSLGFTRVSPTCHLGGGGSLQLGNIFWLKKLSLIPKMRLGINAEYVNAEFITDRLSDGTWDGMSILVGPRIGFACGYNIVSRLTIAFIPYFQPGVFANITEDYVHAMFRGGFGILVMFRPVYFKIQFMFGTSKRTDYINNVYFNEYGYTYESAYNNEYTIPLHSVNLTLGFNF